MRRLLCVRTFTLVSLVALFGPGCRPPEPALPSSDPVAVAQPQEARAPAPRFGWKAGARANVVERILKRGRWATTRYTLHVEADGDALLVYYRDFEITAIEGLDLSDPEVRRQLIPVVEQLAGAIPPYRIAADGTWLGLDDPERIVDAVATVLPAKDVEAMRRLFANPEMRTMLDERLRDTWRAWSETWVGLTLQEGERVDVQWELEVMGAPVAMAGTVERLRTDDGSWHFRATSSLEGDAARAVMASVVGAAAESLGKPPGEALDRFLARANVERSTLVEAVLDPATSMPRRAASTMEATIEAEGDTHTLAEQHEWTFEWR